MLDSIEPTHVSKRTKTFLELIVTLADNGWKTMTNEQKVLFLTIGVSIFQSFMSTPVEAEVKEPTLKPKAKSRKRG